MPEGGERALRDEISKLVQAAELSGTRRANEEKAAAEGAAKLRREGDRPIPRTVRVRLEQLSDLRTRQVRLDTYVRGYIELQTIAGQCEQLRRKLEHGRSDPRELTARAYWRDLLERLKNIKNLRADLSDQLGGQLEQVTEFDQHLERALGLVNSRLRSAFDESADDIVGNAHVSIEIMEESVGEMASETKKLALGVLGDISELIIEIFARIDAQIELSRERVDAASKGADLEPGSAPTDEVLRRAKADKGLEPKADPGVGRGGVRIP